MNRITLLLVLLTATFTATFTAAPLSFAQDGKPAGRFAEKADGTAWYDVNPDTWDSFESFDFDRYFGSWEQQAFVLDFDYESETVIWGTKTAQQSIRPRFQWLGPLFAGDGYTSVEGLIPLDSEYTQQMWIYGGWKYHLTPDIDIDVGGNIVLANKDSYGPGIPVTSGQGWTERGTVYLGLIGRVLFNPSAYIIYDFSLDQKIVLLGIFQDWDLHEEFGLPEGFELEFQSRFGWLQANGWLGNGRDPNGNQWRNGYLYMTSRVDLIYRFDFGLKTYIGARHAMNNDGVGPVGINGTDMGPEQMMWFGGGVSYEF